MSHEPSANTFLHRFDRNRDVSWCKPSIQALYAAGMEGEKDGSWADHAPAGNILVARQPEDPAASPYGTSVEQAERKARDRIASLRAEAEKLEGLLNAYGGEAFIENLKPVPADKSGDVVAILSTIASDHDVRFVRINGREFSRCLGPLRRTKG